MLSGVFNPLSINDGYNVIDAPTPLGIAVLKGHCLITDQIRDTSAFGCHGWKCQNLQSYHGILQGAKFS